MLNKVEELIVFSTYTYPEEWEATRCVKADYHK
jgi:hypothetical protein